MQQILLHRGINGFLHLRKEFCSLIFAGLKNLQEIFDEFFVLCFNNRVTSIARLGLTHTFDGRLNNRHRKREKPHSKNKAREEYGVLFRVSSWVLKIEKRYFFRACFG